MKLHWLCNNLKWIQRKHLFNSESNFKRDSSIDFPKSHHSKKHKGLSLRSLFTGLICSQLFISLTDNPYKWKTNNNPFYNEQILNFYTHTESSSANNTYTAGSKLSHHHDKLLKFCRLLSAGVRSSRRNKLHVTKQLHARIIH